jgi:peptidoglycan/LPS O-acetylase OafA/YrhL
MRRIPELDGLRGVAVLLVFSAHLLGGAFPANRPFAKITARGWGGGFVGVQLFFVLSGFLITSILLRERDDDGTVSLRKFYGRRARRLLPALVLVCTAYATYALLVLHGSEVRAAFGSIAYALTYTTNLKPLLSSLPDSHWLSHTWSLAIEEQFYLVWPVCFLLAMHRWGRNGVALVALAGAMTTVVARSVMWHGPESYQLVYERLRWDALLIGCLLAAHPIRVRRELVWIAGAYLLYFACFPPPGLQPIYSYATTALASGALVIGCRDLKFLRNRTLVWFGLISYGLYLWHVMVMRLGYPGPVSLVLSIAIAQLSYVLVERRFLAGRSAPQPR